MEPEELTFRINRASDGVEINVQTYIYPIRNATGTVVGVCGAAQDITSQVSGERALLQAKDEAAKESAQFFLATMTHELRTPLTSIIGYIDLLDDTHLDTSQREYILDAKRGAKTLLALINNILDYSKLAAGAIELDTHAMQVSDLLSDVRAIAKDLGHGTTLVVGPYTGPPTVAADSLRIRQVLLNLVSNAMKFTAPDGNVDITTAWESDKSDDSVFLEFTVKDSGIGMSKEVMARLFHPFVQAAPSTSRHYGGTGLGLSIVKRLVEAMKGTLSVHSIEGTGTTFTVRIPARIISMSMLFSGASSATLTSNGGHTPPSSELHNSPFAMNHQPTSPPHTPPPSRPSVDPEIAATTRILFAEDNPITQTLVKRMLKPLRVETAVNGAIAIDMVAAAVAADEPYTVLLCDLNMAIMDGIDTAREIRRRYHRKPNTSSSSSSSSDSKNTSSNSTGTIHTNTVMYIVGLSASAFTQDRDRCLDAGMDAFLSKPFTKQGLLAAVATAIASQRCSAP
ncbi:histidine kinase-like ATPase [Powellomyces hirtus]|nr:histidine kinase-like ATPase [Powellomyces hirtus]